jgi:hypothetical protein
MNGLRTVISAVAILVGSALIVVWLIAFALVRSVEDGSAARSAAQVALKSPAVMNHVSAEIYARTAGSLLDLGLDVEALGVGGAVRSAAETVTESDEFEQVLLDSVDAASGQLHRDLTDPHRPAGPFAVEVDASETLSAELRTVPVVGDSLANVRLRPISVEVVSAESFETARDSYERLEFAKRAFGWMGLACLAIGLIVSTRKRYVVGKFLIAVGAFALLAGLVLAVLTPERLVDLVPGGGGSWGQLIADALGDEQVPRLRTVLLLVGSSAVILGAAILGATAARWGRVAAPRR